MMGLGATKVSHMMLLRTFPQVDMRIEHSDGAVMREACSGRSNVFMENNSWHKTAGPLCVLSAIAVVIGSLATLDMLWYPLSVLLLGLVLWFPSGIVALWQRQFWWATASLALIVAAMSPFAMLFIACSRGDCL